MNIRKRESRFASVGYLLGSGYLWLARDLNGSIAAYSHKPFKLDDESWRVEEGESKEMWMWVDDGDLYNFVKWEDDEPVNIREWLEKEEEDMKMYSVKDGELQCKEVDADFFDKNTTLGGLLSSKEVELDRDNRKESLSNLNANSITTGTLNAPNMWLNPLTDTIQFTNPTTSDEAEFDRDTKIIPDSVDMASYDDLTVTPLFRFPYLTSNMMATEGQDYDEIELDRNNKIIPDDVVESEGATTIKVNAGNSGESFLQEYAGRIREALESKASNALVDAQFEMFKDMNATGPVQIMADNYMWDSNGQIQDVASMYPPHGLTLDDINNVKIHENICKELNETYEKKNADYGNSFENSLDKHGLIAGIVRMDDKMSRLISLNSKNEQQVLDESLRDTLMDLANYAIMSVMWLDEQ